MGDECNGNLPFVDDRIVYGATCTWWDTIYSASTVGEAKIPCCPFCKGVLFETREAQWWAAVDKADEAYPGYRARVEWSRGKCFPTQFAAIEAYGKRGETKQEEL